MRGRQWRHGHSPAPSRVFSALILYAIAPALIGYFDANAYSGNYGLNAREVLEQQAAALAAELISQGARMRSGFASGRARLEVIATWSSISRVSGPMIAGTVHGKPDLGLHRPANKSPNRPAHIPIVAANGLQYARQRAFRDRPIDQVRLQIGPRSRRPNNVRQPATALEPSKRVPWKRRSRVGACSLKPRT